ncbi:glycosyltransferase family 2 protein [Arenibacter algicola]|uniref:glycosyltransferase family 2 protein n=1 Tax=Arenibacter algicola TaxID=616991 RepID=UPI001C0718AA|nr:glycosyltransferase family 2 protein [Arenibacter algicola]MBU2903428.1 glycosyltransferase family 2 protein [Arenibacter algicola]
MNNILLSITVPCYNEEKNIAILVAELGLVLEEYDYEIILVNDGSTDQTQQVIEFLAIESDKVKFISLSRNFGHQKAIKAGIDHAKGDCIVTMDADLQHPPQTIPEMIALWELGNKVVTAVRSVQGQGSFFKKYTSKLFYLFLSKISNQDVVGNSSDFRLFDKKIVDILRKMPEQDLYIRGLVPWIGFKQTTIKFNEGRRVYGKTKYTLKKMLLLASNGITSSGIKPLRFALSAGILFAMLAFGYGIYAVIATFLGLTVSGWSSIIASIMFLSGIQLMVLGVMGEYLGKMYMANKQRPNYIVSNTNISKKIENDNQQERRAAMF